MIASLPLATKFWKNLPCASLETDGSWDIRELFETNQQQTLGARPRPWVKPAYPENLELPRCDVELSLPTRRGSLDPETKVQTRNHNENEQIFRIQCQYKHPVAKHGM